MFLYPVSWHKQEMEQSWEGAARHQHGTVQAGRANKACALTNYSFSWIFGLLRSLQSQRKE